MTDEPLLLEIVHALEEQGLARDEYQLQRVIDVEALERVVDSTGPQTDLEIWFSVGEFRVVVTPSDVAAVKTS
ncbi:HalOD1 output domain-containing protein [Natronolimnohabitans sp. A-GB9]|uniref:HalOD1 output domain-containing protein n=1 Tax=Natronolimnohabitans sp. A-GB9 TaxID=3069757 RepID=UPI0027AE4D68|nr:HalOD1 output domain-containing protein [Natronolimnohabitans sp. A-GB9]MDQ2051660.1 HalOD1 output domain-containing protein [Natronolimnohabitans sp. A-GB9]